MNISGNFDTTQKEIDSVKEIFQNEGVEFKSIIKNPDGDAGDILVTLKNDKKILVEVKEESYDRFSRYGDLGIDFISVFYLKNNSQNWKGSPKNHTLLSKFRNDIDRTKPYKDGKLYYSKSDLCSAMTSVAFRDYRFNNCLFAINNKPSWQLSCSDNHNSAVFFINHEDDFLKQFKVDLKVFLAKKQ